jgi:UDP-N-acetylmuramoylalanine--D-glutamate ligase
MKPLNHYQNKTVLVLGLAKSGEAVSRLMRQMGARVIVSDIQERSRHEEAIKRLEQAGIEVISGEHPLELLDRTPSLIIKNPGIPYHIPFVQEAIRRGIPIVTEVEIAYEMSEAGIIGITGSNGKTTTTTLVGEMLKEGGIAARVAGNIGTVLSEAAFKAGSDETIVAELSSFQLQGTRRFRPHIAVLLNLYEAHLDYHRTFDDYVLAKMKLFQNQTASDYAVLNADQPISQKIAGEVKSRIFWFSVGQPVARGTMINNGEILFLSEQQVKTAIMPVSEIMLPGAHNLENVLAAVCTAMLAGVPADAIRRVLKRFKGVEHRLEFVAERNGVRYYNDSKATNPQAAIRAIQAFNQPVILIAGGLDRGIDFLELLPAFKSSVKGLIAYGQSKAKLMAVGRQAGLKQVISVDTVSESVYTAQKMASPGDIVLLSPACASWDMFRSFEERGCMFKETVHTL